MSIEMSTLLTHAAPSPAGAPDVAAIMKRGDRVRAQRMLVTIVAVPLLVGALWAGARAGVNLSAPVPPTPAATALACEQWPSDTLTVFLDSDTPLEAIIGLAADVRRLDLVRSVRWNDLWERSATLRSDLPRLSERLARRSFPPWLDVRLYDPADAGAVVAAFPYSPYIDDIAGWRQRSTECRLDHLRIERNVLRRQLRELQEKLDARGV